MASRPANVDQLRSDIDQGRTGDKVPAFDPAAAPLGTDDEAAGTPVSPERLALTKQEYARPQHQPPQERVGHAWILIGFIIGLAAIFVTLPAGRVIWGWF